MLKFHHFIQYFLILVIFENLITVKTIDSSKKEKETQLFITNNNDKKEVINHLAIESRDIQVKDTEEEKYKDRKLVVNVSEIYESGHFVSLSHKCLNHGTKVKLLIPILSDPWHYLARKAIRETWGIFGKRKDVIILFFLGSTSDPYLEIKLAHEQKIFDDIVRCNVYDSYTNLTLKTISILEWVDRYCFNVNFVLKTDDDVFLNMPRLLTFVRLRLKLNNVIFGKISPHTKPHRNKENKYYVPIIQYKFSEYPPFVTGPAYLLSGNSVHRLHKESLNTPFLKLEDVFVTGIVAEKLGIKRIDRQEFVNNRISFSVCELQRSISLHSIKPTEQHDLWERLFECNPDCPYFCIQKSSTSILMKNNFLLLTIAFCTASLTY
ncbi:beta-1,3-galactosyltransferase 1-like [Leptopilina heterotoma]|uniref:beta-1,3-galactosyltransferase 1-like n=1 Tax=Leptopilina heterotoma TaxID=63436 RepID=UPI001CA8DA71|nr:beta-1,3-galactosyltransferase 1-like [Leptopilina heterotoma]